MGTLILPASAVVYLEVAPIIYSVERHADYFALMQPVWLALQNKQITVVTSELTLLETLVAPLKNNNAALVAAYENSLTKFENAMAFIGLKTA